MKEYPPQKCVIDVINFLFEEYLQERSIWLNLETMRETDKCFD